MSGTRVLGVLVGLVALARLASAADRLKVAVDDRLRPAGPGEVRLSGRVGEKLRLCVANRLLDQDVQALVVPYRAKREVGGNDWRCEYWGKWFTALALADAYDPTAATAAVRDYGTAELLWTAAPDGYLGTRRPADRTKGWDVWGCKYTLLGLLAGYDRTDDPATLRAARRLGDVLVAELGPGGANVEDVGEWNGLPASSVLEPVALLYERTGDPRYLAFARHLVACWDKPSKRLPGGMRLVEDATAGRPPAAMCAPKAYEMMSCFEGLCELYRATGQREDLDAAVALARSVREREATLVGCGTSNEVWCDGATKQTRLTPKPMETCVTATWMKLNLQLLRLTGDVRYADELERNLYNGLLGAMTPRGDWWAYFSGQMGVRVPSYVQHADCGTSCCVLNGPRGLMVTPSWAMMRGPAGPVVNLYGPSTGRLRTPAGQAVTVVVRGDYPVGDRVEIVVGVDRPETFPIGFRIPGWSPRTELMVNGEAVAAEPGTYASVRREWRAGDRVSVGFDMRGRVVAAPDGNGQVAVVRGPIVLSLDNRLAPPADSSAVLTAGFADLVPNPAAATRIGAWMAYDVPVVVGGGRRTLTFCDYADAGNAFSRANVFRTWLPQPLDLRTVYDCGQTWQSLTHANNWTDVPAPPVRVDDPHHDLALAIHGATATSDGEFAPEAGCTARVNDGIVATATDFANRWHSSVESPHPHWVQVKLPRPARVGTVVIHFADPAGAAVDFHCLATVDGADREVLRVAGNREVRTYRAEVGPVVTDTVRLVIDSSANGRYPNAAQVSEIELFAAGPTTGPAR